MSTVTMMSAAIRWAKENMPLADGFNSGECACTFDDPAPCGQFSAECEIARKRNCCFCDEYITDGRCSIGRGYCMMSLTLEGGKQ